MNINQAAEQYAHAIKQPYETDDLKEAFIAGTQYRQEANTFTLGQVGFIVSRFICMHCPEYSTKGNQDIFINESIKDPLFIKNYGEHRQGDIGVLVDALSWYADAGNYMFDDIQLATAYVNDNLSNKAKIALRKYEQQAKEAIEGQVDKQEDGNTDLEQELIRRIRSWDREFSIYDAAAALKQHYHITKKN